MKQRSDNGEDVVDLLVLTAMASEFAAVARGLGPTRALREEYRSHLTQVGDKKIAIVQMGIGPARAREVASWSLRRFDPRHALVFGVAGGLSPDLVRTDIVWANRLVSTSGVELTVDSSRWKKLASPAHGSRHLEGTILQSERVIAKCHEKAKLCQTTGALAVDMESLAVVQSCLDHSIPVGVARVIIDTAHDELPPEVGQIMSEAGDPRLGQAFLHIARRPKLLFELLAMERGNRPVVKAMRQWATSLRDGIAAIDD